MQHETDVLLRPKKTILTIGGSLGSACNGKNDLQVRAEFNDANMHQCATIGRESP